MRIVLLHLYAPTQVKQAIVGYGKATKAQMQKMTQVLLKLKEPPRPDHAADALALALCHARSYKVLELKKKVYTNSNSGISFLFRGILGWIAYIKGVIVHKEDKTGLL